MISGPQRKFCEGIVTGLKKGEAYRAAYPGTSVAAAGPSATGLLKNPKIKAEINRLIAKAESKVDGAVLTMAEVLTFIARVVRCRPELEPSDSDLWQSIKRTRDGTEYRMPDKLGAIARWCDLKGEGSEAAANDELAKLLERVRK